MKIGPKLPRFRDINDWFIFDFTLAELKTLKMRQPSDSRDPQYDWSETVVTLKELVNITM